MMMTRIATTTTAGSRVIPVVLLATLALAVSVWVLPMPFDGVRTREIVARTPNIGRDDGNTLAIDAKVPTHDWLSLEEGLNSIRIPAPERPEPVAADENTGGYTEEPPQQTAAHLPPLMWKYVGFIAQPNGRIAAVLETEFGTRIMYVNGQIQDTNDPQQRMITITEVTREKIVIRRAGNELEIELEKRRGTEGFDDYGMTDN